MPGTIALLLSYDGTRYHGFQRQQRHGKMAHLTVQHCLEHAVAAVFGKRIAVHPAGRTDAGVHALGQVISFRAESEIPMHRLPYALNRYLPDDIVVRAGALASTGFHARKSAKRKTYRYALYRHEFPSPFWRGYTYHWRGPLDIAQMQAAAKLLVGYHDFRGFRATGSSVRTSDRTLYSLIVRERGPFLTITAEADGFLYNMVRIVAGTLLEVGSGRKTLAHVKAALATGDRNEAGRTLPAHGLCLINVDYGVSLWPPELVDNEAFPALK